MADSPLSGAASSATTPRWARWAGWIVLLVSIAVTLLCWRFALTDERHSAIGSLLLGAGLLISLLLSGLVWALVHTRQLAARMAQEMSVSLRQSEERWDLAIDGIGAGVTDWNIETGEIGRAHV